MSYGEDRLGEHCYRELREEFLRSPVPDGNDSVLMGQWWERMAAVHNDDYHDALIAENADQAKEYRERTLDAMREARRIRRARS